MQTEAAGDTATRPEPLLQSNRVVPVAICIALIGGLGAPASEPPRKPWFGTVAVNIKLQVLDEETSAPVKSARLALVDPFARWRNPLTPDEKGFVSVTADFEAVGFNTPRERVGRVTFHGWLFQASAEGYLTRLAPLVDVVSDSTGFPAPPDQRGTVRLLRARTGRLPARPVFEQYQRCDEWWRTIRLLVYGDRFYEVLSVPAEDFHPGWFESACGSLRREDSVAKLAVERRRKIKGDDDNWHLDNLRRVPWGARLYLVSESQRLAFCNAVNQGIEPRANDYGEFFLRDGDRKKPVAGPPAVPTPWEQYLLGKPVRAKVVKLFVSGEAVIDAGSVSGLRNGMELVPAQEYLFSEQVVESVEPNSAVLRTKHPNGRYRRASAHTGQFWQDR